MKKEQELHLGDLILLWLYMGSQGVYLFVSDVPYIDPE